MGRWGACRDLRGVFRDHLRIIKHNSSLKRGLGLDDFLSFHCRRFVCGVFSSGVVDRWVTFLSFIFSLLALWMAGGLGSIIASYFLPSSLLGVPYLGLAFSIFLLIFYVVAPFPRGVGTTRAWIVLQECSVV